jgi:hypothetical protein
MIYTQFRIKRYLPIFFSIFISSIFLSNCARLPNPIIKNYESPYKTVKSCSDEDYYKSSKGKKMDLRKFLSDCGDMGHYNYKKAYSLLISNPVLSISPSKVSLPKKTTSPQKELCSDGKYHQSSKGKKMDLRKFLSDCGDMGHYNYKKAYSLLISNPSLPNPKVSLPKKTTSPQKVTDKSEKSQTIVIPTGSLGEISEIRKSMLEKTLESKLDDYFAIVPKELFEEAQEQAFQEMDSDECTEDQCILMIKEILQIENAFKMDLMYEDGNTQISITWNDQDQKRVEEDYCEGCGTGDLRKMIGGLVEKLVKGNN